MKIIPILAALFLLTACGSEYEPAVEWSGNITEQNEKFILSYDEAIFTESQLSKVEQWWVEVQTCTGVSVEIHKPITIEYVDSVGSGMSGRIEYNDNYISVWQYDLMENQSLKGQITKHELIHYLIYSISGNHSHNHIFFSLCD
jgi:hypothetical protein